MKKMMYDVVYNGFAYNKGYSPDNVSIAGKTGTAQIASSRGGYLTGPYDYIKSFAGFFPYEDPQYVIYFSTKRLVSNSADLMKVVSSAVGEIAKVKNLSSVRDDEQVTKVLTMNHYVSKSLDVVLEDTKKLGLQAIVIGDGNYITNQYPSTNAKVLVGSKVFLLTNGGNYKMPDVRGWSTNEIIRFCNFIGLSYHLNGYGKVSSTSIDKDAIIDLNTTLEINLES